MSRYPDGIFVKVRGSINMYERELGTSYNPDKDEEVQKDISKLEELATFVRRSTHRCEMTETFLENISIIGGLYEKYNEFSPLKEGSASYRRFHDAMKKANLAKSVFAKDCDCKYKKKFN